jgi:hypothetical protein
MVAVAVLSDTEALSFMVKVPDTYTPPPADDEEEVVVAVLPDTEALSFIVKVPDTYTPPPTEEGEVAELELEVMVLPDTEALSFMVKVVADTPPPLLLSMIFVFSHISRVFTETNRAVLLFIPLRVIFLLKISVMVPEKRLPAPASCMVRSTSFPSRIRVIPLGRDWGHTIWSASSRIV